MKHSQHDKDAHKQDTHLKDINADLLKALIQIRDDPNQSPVDIRTLAAAAVAKAEG
jgi:hypothetical protein